MFISSIQRLGYQDNDPYDWEKSIDMNQTDSLTLLEQEQKLSSPSPSDERKIIPENNILSKRNLSTLLRSNKKNHRQRSSYDSNRIKHVSNGTGDQSLLNPENRSPDTVTRRSTTHKNITDHAQAASNGLLTYISQQFSTAAVPSVFSQWSPHNGEALTDDEILKGNKSTSSKNDESKSPINTRLNHSSERKSHMITVNSNDNENNYHKEYYLPSKHQYSIEQNIPVPFSTYVKNNQRLISRKKF